MWDGTGQPIIPLDLPSPLEVHSSATGTGRQPSRGTKRDTMTNLSLRDAATLCGRGKSTIQRAIKSGQLSANRSEAGGYEIDAAELYRVFPFSIDAGQLRDRTDGTNPSHDFIGPPARPTASHGRERGRDSRDSTAGGTGQGADATTYLSQMLDREKEAARALQAALQARLDDQAETIADLRKRLDTAEAEKMRLLPAPDAGHEKAPAKRQGLIGRIFRGRD